ncbi:hypothetical protein BCV69DRAFT_310567 [Microstroma glucosiphilum]|uniref:Non-classical export protein 1 n=1 Tax=Pseudomicrostroma glucosiphilum TaxID=1684307 RepID=A0A316UDV7_9BASI|nr:hypothetical protein BCV69DRAFT_310567 [Pseudomicrostroma glucosiphilum]PWN23078.1 hypothetical protein BCV69DRAFT_310567 [Pseudomicrostroma glucosiphilum]
MPAYLVGRLADPILGLSTGVLAYYLWEYDPRNDAQRPEGRKLVDLARRRFGGGVESKTVAPVTSTATGTGAVGKEKVV